MSPSGRNTTSSKRLRNNQQLLAPEQRCRTRSDIRRRKKSRDSGQTLPELAETQSVGASSDEKAGAPPTANNGICISNKSPGSKVTESELNAAAARGYVVAYKSEEKAKIDQDRSPDLEALDGAFSDPHSPPGTWHCGYNERPEYKLWSPQLSSTAPLESTTPLGGCSFVVPDMFSTAASIWDWEKEWGESQDAVTISPSMPLDELPSDVDPSFGWDRMDAAN